MLMMEEGDGKPWKETFHYFACILLSLTLVSKQGTGVALDGPQPVAQACSHSDPLASLRLCLGCIVSQGQLGQFGETIFKSGVLG